MNSEPSSETIVKQIISLTALHILIDLALSFSWNKYKFHKYGWTYRKYENGCHLKFSSL